MPDYSIADFQYIDSHTHFFPERLFKAIWAYWERVIRQFYSNWINKYEWPNVELVEFLRAQQIKRFTTLNYAHKKGVAEELNEWTHNFCEKYPEAIPLALPIPLIQIFLNILKKP
jgi:hypothetical protein